MKKRILSIIIALLGLVSGARAAVYCNVYIYDGRRVTNNDIDILMAISEFDGKLQRSQTSDGFVFKTLSGTTLFSYSNSTMKYSVPTNITCDNDMRVLLSDYSMDYLKSLYPQYADYDGFYLHFEVAVNEQNFPDKIFRDWVHDNIAPDRINRDQQKNDFSIDVSQKGISNLKGIEYFTNLLTLNCSGNQLTSLDLSKNTNLARLDCSDNKLTSLKVSPSSRLYEITCYFNKISGSQMDAFISSLPTVTNRSLYVISMPDREDNLMTCKQVGNAKKKGWTPKYMYGSGLSEYYGSDAVVAINTTNFPDANFRSYVSSNCDTDGNGWLDESEIAATTYLGISDKSISDLTGISYFTELTELFCSNNNLTTLDLKYNTRLNSLNCSNNKLTSMSVLGLENLEWLNCSNNNLGTLNLSTCSKMRFLDCSGNRLSTLTMQGGSIGVPRVLCNGNKLSGNSMTTFVNSLPTATQGEGNLYVLKSEASSGGNQITTAQVQTASRKGYNVWVWNATKSDWVLHSDSQANAYVMTIYDGTTMANTDETALVILTHYGQIRLGSGLVYAANNSTLLFSYDNAKKCSVPTAITPDYDVTLELTDGMKYVLQNQFPAFANYDRITLKFEVALNEQNFTDAKFLSFVSRRLDTDNNGRLSRTELTNVTKIDDLSYGITSLKGIEYFTELETLICRNNQLKSLDLSKNTALTYLSCSSNQLTTLDLSKHKRLGRLDCGFNQLKSLIVSPENNVLWEFVCYVNNLNGSGVDALINSLPVRSPAADARLSFSYPQNESATGNSMTSAQIQAAADKGWAVWRYGNNGWEIDPSSDAIAIDETNFPDYWFRQEVGGFDTDEDQYLSTAEIAEVTEIRYGGLMESLKGIEFFTELETLDIGNCPITELDLSKNTKLKYLQCYDCQLTGTLDLSKNTMLESLDCWNNQLEEINVSQCGELGWIRCYNNRLTSLDLSSSPKMYYIECYGNQIQGKDFHLPTFDAPTPGEKGWLEFYNGPSDGNMMTKQQALSAKNKGWDVIYKETGEYLGVGGDANGDGIIDEQDVDTMRDYILGRKPNPFSMYNADANNDSTVDIVDLTLLIQYLTE